MLNYKTVRGPFRRTDRTGWWLAWRNEAGREHKRKYPTKQIAVRAKQVAEERLNNWTSDPADTLWEAVVDEYVEHLALASRSHQSAAKTVLRRLALAGTMETMADFTPAIVDRYFARRDQLEVETEKQRKGRRKPVSANTRRRDWRYLKAFCSWANGRGYCDDFMRRYPAPPAEHRLKPDVESREWVALLRTLPDVDAISDAQGWHILILLAVATGLRQSALLSIRLGDITLGARETNNIGLLKSYTTKTRKEKLHGLPAVVSNRLAQRIADLPEGTTQLFHWTRWPRKQWDAIKAAAGFPHTFHGLRASAGTDAAIARLRAEGAHHLDHSSASVFERSYEGHRRLALAVAERLELPALPPLPAYSHA